MKSISKGTTGRDLKVSQNLLEPKGLYATLSPAFNQQSHASAHWGFRLTIDTVNALMHVFITILYARVIGFF